MVYFVEIFFKSFLKSCLVLGSLFFVLPSSSEDLVENNMRGLMKEFCANDSLCNEYVGNATALKEKKLYCLGKKTSSSSKYPCIRLDRDGNPTEVTMIKGSKPLSIDELNRRLDAYAKDPKIKSQMDEMKKQAERYLANLENKRKKQAGAKSTKENKRKKQAGAKSTKENKRKKQAGAKSTKENKRKKQAGAKSTKENKKNSLFKIPLHPERLLAQFKDYDPDNYPLKRTPSTAVNSKDSIFHKASRIIARFCHEGAPCK